MRRYRIVIDRYGSQWFGGEAYTPSSARKLAIALGEPGFPALITWRGEGDAYWCARPRAKGGAS